MILKTSTLWLCVLLLLWASQANAQQTGWEPLLQASDGQRLRALGDEVIKRDPVVAIRLSTRFLNELISQPFVLTSPIETTFEGATVRGTATFHGRKELCFDSLRNNQPLTVLLRGKIETFTTASKGPAVVRNCGTTHISGEFQLAFDGKRFSNTPIAVDACTTSRLHSVCSTGRFAGRLVRAVARRRVEEKRPVTNAAASRRAKEKIENEGNRALEDAVADLNRSSRLDKTVESVFANFPEPTLQVTTTEAFLQALATTASEIKASPPGNEMLGDAAAELWVRVEPDSPLLEKVEALWESAKPEIAELLEKVEDVQLQLEDIVTRRRVGDWIVIEIAARSIARISS